MNDPRFASKLNTPLFGGSKKRKSSTKDGESEKKAKVNESVSVKPVEKNTNKIVVDDRFSAMLTDEKFGNTSAGSVDKYGRKKKRKQQAKSELEEFYELEEPVAQEPENNAKEKRTDIEDRLDYLNKLARGELDSSDDENELEDVEDDDDDEDVEEVVLAEDDFDDDNEPYSVLQIPGDNLDYGDSTKRLAIQNCDWDNFRSVDIL